MSIEKKQTCDYCGKPIDDNNSISVSMSNKECGVYCSSVCFQKMISKNSKNVRAYINSKRCFICDIVSPTGTEFIIDETSPEIARSVWICSDKCKKIFFRRIKKNRVKDLRDRLEKDKSKISQDEQCIVMEVLTPKEKKTLSIIGLAYIWHQSNKTNEDFFKRLKQFEGEAK